MNSYVGKSRLYIFSFFTMRLISKPCASDGNIFLYKDLIKKPMHNCFLFVNIYEDNNTQILTNKRLRLHQDQVKWFNH